RRSGSNCTTYPFPVAEIGLGSGATLEREVPSACGLVRWAPPAPCTRSPDEADAAADVPRVALRRRAEARARIEVVRLVVARRAPERGGRLDADCERARGVGRARGACGAGRGARRRGPVRSRAERSARAVALGRVARPAAVADGRDAREPRAHGPRGGRGRQPV